MPGRRGSQDAEKKGVLVERVSIVERQSLRAIRLTKILNGRCRSSHLLSGAESLGQREHHIQLQRGPGRVASPTFCGDAIQ